jgi:hypothetical protein
LSKKQLLIYFIFLAIFLLLLLDAFLFKANPQLDKIDYFSNIVTRDYRHHSYSTEILFAKSGLKLQLPDNRLDVYFSDTCSLVVNRSKIFNMPLSFSIAQNGKQYYFATGILNNGYHGKVIVTIILISFVLSFFQNIISSTKKKMHFI